MGHDGVVGVCTGNCGNQCETACCGVGRNFVNNKDCNTACIGKQCGGAGCPKGISHCCNCFEPVIGRRAEEKEEKLPGCDPAPKKEGGQGCDCRTEELIETKQGSDGTFSETGNKVLVS